MLDQFTYAEYADLLARLRHGRVNLCFADFADGGGPGDEEPFFLLRHDIDLSIEAALEMARREAEMEVRATYFLLLSCEHYNLLAEEHAGAARELVGMGHEVGLHYDVRAIARRSDDPASQLRLEADLLSALAGAPVRSIAMHLPGLHGEDPFAGGTEFVNAYDSRFTDEIAYFSDSCGAWRDNAVEALESDELPPRLQLLTHPFYWRTQPGDRWERLDRWGTALRRRIEGIEERIRRVWNAHDGAREHDERIRRRS
ncbi:MAG: hypothetical protein PVJ49_00320 [Acidobacteriota bacterium]|jgi:hypothetical protein